MKFYITEETKKELVEKIEKIDKKVGWTLADDCEVRIYKEILSSSVVLPIESPDTAFQTGDDDVNHYIENIACLPSKYPNGLIIH